MTFERHFGIESCSRQEQFARFVAGLSPAMLQRNDPAVAVDFPGQRGRSTVMACDLRPGVTSFAMLELVQGRGTLRPAPWAMQFDAYEQKLSFSWRPFGNASPLRPLLRKLIRPRLGMA